MLVIVRSGVASQVTVFEVVWATKPFPDAVATAFPVPAVRVNGTVSVTLFCALLNRTPAKRKLSVPVSEASALQFRLSIPLPCQVTVSVPLQVFVLVSVLVIARVALKPGAGFAADADVAVNARMTTTAVEAVSQRRIRMLLPSLVDSADPLVLTAPEGTPR